MKSSFKDKFTKFSVFIVLYSFFIFVFFNLVFSKNELKYSSNVTNVSLNTNKNFNINGIDLSKLSTKVNTGKTTNILTKEDVIEGLKNSDDKDVQDILKNKDKLNFGYLALLYRNPSSKFFIKDKLNNKVVDNFTGESVDFNRSIPYYLQWDRRWGQKKYTDDNIAINGCGPTCMAMVVSGLLKNDSITPVEMSKYDKYTAGSGTDWEYFKEVPKKYGIKVKELPTDEKVYKNELKKERPIIVNVRPGDFTSVGHYIVLVEVDKDGMFIVNDPNSPTNTNEKWSFDRLKPQIKNGWSFYKGD